MRNKFNFWILLGTLVSACAPFDENSTNIPGNEVGEAEDSGEEVSKDSIDREITAADTRECAKGLRVQEFPLVKLSENELKEIENIAPIDTQEYPLTTSGIGNNFAGLKQTPYSRKKQLAYHVDLSRYIPLSKNEIPLGLKFEIPVIRKFSKKKREFICFIESGQCSGKLSRKVRKHLRDEWKDAFIDEAFSKKFFDGIGTWRSISLGRGALVYEKKKFFTFLYLPKNNNLFNLEILSKKKLTVVIGTQTYFEPEGAKFVMMSSFCRDTQ